MPLLPLLCIFRHITRYSMWAMQAFACVPFISTCCLYTPASVMPKKNRCTIKPALSLIAAAAVATMPHDMVMLPYHHRAPRRIVRKVEGMWAKP